MEQNILGKIKSHTINFFREKIAVWHLILFGSLCLVFETLGIMVYGYSKGVEVSLDIESIKELSFDLLYLTGFILILYVIGKMTPSTKS